MLTIAFAIAFAVVVLAAVPRSPQPVGVIDSRDVVTVTGDESDLPCPWCLTPTREDDRVCPGCGQTFG